MVLFALVDKRPGLFGHHGDKFIDAVAITDNSRPAVAPHDRMAQNLLLENSWRLDLVWPLPQ